MRYLARALKYFIYLAAIFFLIIGALVVLKFVPADWDEIFRNGTDSLLQIGIVGAVFAIIYPRFGYMTRAIPVFGPLEENAADIVKYMEARGYVQELAKAHGKMVFHKGFFLSRIVRLGEDRITFTTDICGINIEGPSRDVVRIASGLEAFFSENR